MSNYQISLVIMACVSMITVCGVFCITSLAGMFSLGQAAHGGRASSPALAPQPELRAL